MLVISKTPLFSVLGLSSNFSKLLTECGQMCERWEIGGFKNAILVVISGVCASQLACQYVQRTFGLLSENAIRISVQMVSFRVARSFSSHEVYFHIYCCRLNEKSPFLIVLTPDKMWIHYSNTNKIYFQLVWMKLKWKMQMISELLRCTHCFLRYS